MTAQKAITIHNVLTWVAACGIALMTPAIIGLWNMGVDTHDTLLRMEGIPGQMKQIQKDVSAIQRIPFVNSELNKQTQIQ